MDTTKTRTITLTNQRPVSIVEDAWPIVARATHRPGAMRNGTPVPDYETDCHQIRVRQHADGRAIVYAVLDAAVGWTGTEDRRGGEVVPAGGDLAAAIRRVGETCGLLDRVVEDCIADLPAEMLA